MKITICGSIAFIDEMLEAKAKLESMGHEVLMPPTELVDGNGSRLKSKAFYDIRKNGANDSWVWDLKELSMKKHFKKIEWCDAILILNHDKNNIPGYIGGNTLMEMGLALHLNKKIYMIKETPELSYKEEILGVKPVIINDLKDIHS